jgi:hypothetical protein
MGVDLDSWIAKVRACEYLPENDLKTLCHMVCAHPRSALLFWRVPSRAPCTAL